MTRFWTIAILGVLATASHAPAHADRHAEMAAIRAQLQELSARLEALEAADALPSVAWAASAPAAKPRPQHWSDHIKLSGDLRYRHEGIDEQGSEERTRQRVRARVGLTAEVSDKARVGVRLASGSDDPVSTNQSLDDGASTKTVGLDLAYLSLAPTANTEIVAGKMKNPLFRAGKSSLLWDGDLSPEGVAFGFEANGAFVNATALWIEERSSSSDSIMVGAQAGYTIELAGDTEITAGMGHYDYAATRGRKPFFDGEGRGNSLDISGNYLFDYKLTELFAELHTSISNLPFSVYANWVSNSEAASADTGMAFGGRLGKALKPGSWEFGYTYKDLEADAVIATFTDSDIGGGGTAIRGHVIDAGYAFTRRIAAKLTYFLSENRIDTPGERDYNRLQADLSFKY